MALFKCQACGAPLEVKDGTEIAFCPYCGMKQTLPKDPVQVMSDGTSVDSLLKRAFLFLEDREFDKAKEYCDRVLDVEPQSARAYLCKLMADFAVSKRELLAELWDLSLFVNNVNYKKILRFGDEELISEVERYLVQVKFNYAAHNNDADTVKTMLNEGIDVNAGTALKWAAFEGHTEIVKILLNAGADVNAKDGHGGTALMMAYRHIEAVKILLNAGADVNVKDKEGYTALMDAIDSHSPETVKILLNAGADINAKSESGMTALMRAVIFNNLKTVKILLNAGADVNVKDKDGQTALMWARSSRYRNEEIIYALTFASLRRTKVTATTQTTPPKQATVPAQATGCMTMILQALTAIIIITLLAMYL